MKTIKEIMNGKKVQFKGNEEETREFLEMCDAEGIRWRSGCRATDITHQSYINLGFLDADNGLGYGDYKQDYKTITLSELKSEMNQFTKDDLRDWMIVETRNGKKWVYNSYINRFMGKSSYINIGDYDNNLVDKDLNLRDDYDVIKVYRTSAMIIDDIMKNIYLNLIWERVEVDEEQLKRDAERTELLKKAEDMEKQARELREQIERLER